MISNAEYLIQKYAEAREKMQDANTESGRQYWRGSMDTYHNLLVLGFSYWAEEGTTGYYVFYEGMTYDQAINQTTGTMDYLANKKEEKITYCGACGGDASNCDGC